MKRLFVATLLCGAAMTNIALAQQHPQDAPAPSAQTPLVIAAHPRLQHPAYRETVVLVAPLVDGRHLGVIVNRPTTVALSALFPSDVPSRQVREPVYFGGPMAPSTLVMVTEGERSPGGMSVPIGNGFYLAFEQTIIDRVVQTKPNEARYFLGLIHWNRGELREELGQGYWQLVDAPADQVMRTKADRMWKELTNRSRGLVAAASLDPFM